MEQLDLGRQGQSELLGDPTALAASPASDVLVMVLHALLAPGGGVKLITTRYIWTRVPSAS